jgi:glycosyltransferase involved in cell wall biosynthesis
MQAPSVERVVNETAGITGAVGRRQTAKVAVVHDWLTGMRGGEYVLEAILDLFPTATIHTLLRTCHGLSFRLSTAHCETSWMQHIPLAHLTYRALLPLMPSAIEAFDMKGYDLVISSSHCVAKGIRKDPNSVHVSYVHAPMRYMWDRFDDYFARRRASWPVRAAAHLFRNRLQRWDYGASQANRVDTLIANSSYIAEQIRRNYKRHATVVHPFVDLSRFHHPRRAGKHYLAVGAFAPYKRIDVAIEAFNKMGLPLNIVGTGQDGSRLRRIAGPTIRFLGNLSNQEIAALYATCRAFVFPGQEDFGITPLEAMAAGAPVIAYAAGGATETVTTKTGLLFAPQTADALIDAVNRLETGNVTFEETDCRSRAAQFTRAKFQKQFIAVVQHAWQQAGKDIRKLDGAMDARLSEQVLIEG